MHKDGKGNKKNAIKSIKIIFISFVIKEMRLQFFNTVPYIFQSTSMCCRILVIDMLEVKSDKL
jgi:hypothetical protein